MPGYRRPSDEKDSEVQWERIMVQITFAFVIILGYLVSVGLDKENQLTMEKKQLAAEAKQLAAEAELHQQQKQFLETLLVDLRGTELGEAQAGLVAAKKDMQLDRLLRIWAERRVKRRLYTLLRQFDRAELIPLSDDLQCLPTGDSFGELNGELSRVFLVEGENVSQGEVRRLWDDVLEEANYDPTKNPPPFGPNQFDPNQSPREIGELFFDSSRLTDENRERLHLQMIADLVEERRQAVDIQYALVGKIATARRDKLADLPLDFDQQESIDPGEANPGMLMLDRVLEQLRSEMMLLPETVLRIREGTRAD